MFKIRKQEVNNSSLCYWMVLAAPFAIVLPCVGILFAIGVYLFLLISAFSQRKFLRAHARQSLVIAVSQFSLLGLLLLLSADWFMYILIFLVGMVGAYVGLKQVSKGYAWIGHLQIEIEQDLPLPTAQDQEPGRRKPQSKQVNALLKVLRTGNQAAREAALKTLDDLGEVEMF